MSVSSPACSKKLFSDEAEVIFDFINSGVIHSTAFSYPFQLEQKGGVFHLFAQLLVSLGVMRPLILKELGVGQLNQCGILQVWGDMVPILRGIGVASTMVSIYTIGTLSATNSLGIFYLIESFKTPIPWASTNITEEVTTNSSFIASTSMLSDIYYRQAAFPSVINLEDDIKPPHGHLWICLTVSYAIISAVQVICIKYKLLHHLLSCIICITPFCIIVILFLGALINGASPAIKGWDLPSPWVLCDPHFWISSALQCFLCIPLGIGTGIRLSSRCGIHSDISLVAVVSSLSGIVAEILIGLFLYTTLNHHAELTGNDPESLYAVGLAFIFQRVPEYLSKHERSSQFLTILYFTLIVIISGGSILMLSRGLKRTLLDVFPRIPEPLGIIVVNGCGLTLGLPFITPVKDLHGKMLLSLVQTHGIRLMKVVLVILQMIATFVYMPRKLRIDVEFMIQKKLNCFTQFSWVFLVPPVMVAVLVELLITTDFFSYKRAPLPTWASAVGFTLMAIVLFSVLIPGLYEVIQLSWEDGISRGFRKSTMSKETFGPKNERDNRKWKNERISVLWMERSRQINFWN